ncbi:hypothetical protein GIB67_029309 [Kingdonia uniflora]|uniref:Uncharacterized protein n=1 Tax=Kingdonia uniflora TaxID=39325 RepID=A0A7J7N8X5_9MAGN|nr:hypothetical protein GIB67_029309 [Kingdonia uniflora]
MPPKRNFRKRTHEEDDETNNPSEDEEERRLALEEVKFLQKQRERRTGIPAIITSSAQTVGGVALKTTEKNDHGDGEKEELVLQDTFAQETAVLIEDPNMVKYVEQELAKKRGKNIESENQIENDLKRAEDELYVIPEHLKVKKKNSEESSTQWTTGIAEIQLPIEYKLRNIEETEAAKKLLQVKRLSGHPKTDLNIPSSYSADYFQRGRDYAEKLRRENHHRRKESLRMDEIQCHYEVITENHVELHGAHINSCDRGEENKNENLVDKVDHTESDGAFTEEISFQVDKLAEAVWNCYFGRYSKWDDRASGTE